MGRKNKEIFNIVDWNSYANDDKIKKYRPLAIIDNSRNLSNELHHLNKKIQTIHKLQHLLKERQKSKK